MFVRLMAGSQVEQLSQDAPEGRKPFRLGYEPRAERVHDLRTDDIGIEREKNDLGLGNFLPEDSCDFDAVQVRHQDVDDDHVGAQSDGEFHRLHTIRSGSADLDTRNLFDLRLECSSNRLVVVSN